MVEVVELGEKVHDMIHMAQLAAPNVSVDRLCVELAKFLNQRCSGLNLTGETVQVMYSVRCMRNAVSR